MKTYKEMNPHINKVAVVCLRSSIHISNSFLFPPNFFELSFSSLVWSVKLFDSIGGLGMKIRGLNIWFFVC